MFGRDPWNDSYMSYAADIRKELDEVAKSLGAKTRYNSTKKCAELYVPASWWWRREEKVIARVHVTGECCVPGLAKIISQQQPLSDSMKELFTKTLSKVSVRFEVSPYFC